MMDAEPTEPAKPTGKGLFGAGVNLAILGLWVATLAGFLGDVWWRFDLFSHFPVQYAVLSAVGTVVFLVCRRWKQAGVLAFCLLFNGLFIVPFYFSKQAETSATDTYRAMLVNVFIGNKHTQPFLELIANEKPDFIVVNEINQLFATALEAMSTDLPYSRYVVTGSPSGIGVFSRWPLEEVRFEPLSQSDQTAPMVVATVRLGDRKIVLMGVHPMAPVNAKTTADRNLRFQQVAEFCHVSTDPTFVLGDLNCTPWSTAFHKLLRDSGLRNSQQGFGIQTSWPVDMPILAIPIDHCLHSPEIYIQNRRLGPDIGSDHYPLIVDFSVE